VIAVRNATRTLLLTAAVIAPGAVRAEALVFTWAAAAYMDGKEAPLKAPEGVACDDRGAVIVADTGNGRLVRYPLKEGELGPGAEIRVPQLVAPVRVQLDSKGNSVVLDRKGNRLVRLDPKGSYLGVIEPKGDALASFAPVAFKLDAADQVWVLDAAGRVVVLAPDGAVIRTVELPRTGGMFMDVAVDGAGVAYAVDGVRAVVWTADKQAKAFRQLSASLKDEMSFPAYIAAVKGKLLVVDQVGSGIVVLGSDGSFQGRQLSIGASEGLVQYPGQLCTTDRGDVFLADRNNNRLDQYTIAR
jgi:streptogramin lyase